MMVESPVGHIKPVFSIKASKLSGIYEHVNMSDVGVFLMHVSS